MHRQLFFALAITAGALGFAGSAQAHEATFFMPEVPDPSAMVIDGQDGDWSWYDDQYKIDPSKMFDILGGSFPPAADDWNVSLYVAWSRQPDNALYYFARVTDDSLSINATTGQNYWQDDSLEIIVDADHSSENFVATGQVSGQQYGIRVRPVVGEEAWIFGAASASLQWSTKAPYFNYAWTLDPADAQSDQGTAVTYTYEVRQKIWDTHAATEPGNTGLTVSSARAGGSRGGRSLAGPAASSSFPRFHGEHVFAAGEVIGLTFQFDETENAAAGRQMQPGTTPVNGAFQDNSLGSDFITVAAPSGKVATTKNASWGRIKSFMDAR